MATATETLSSGTQNQGNGAGGGGGTSANPGAGSLPTAPNTGWWDTVKDGEVKGWLANKKYPDAEHALKSYWSLERLMGADKAGRTVMLPKDENDAEGWKTLSTKLGVPESADGYKLPMPEGVDEGFAKTASQWFHEAGIPPRQANQITERWNAYMQEQIKAGETADRAESEKQMGTLQKEWGGEFEAKRELAQRGYREFAKQFGLDDKAALERAESVLGASNLTKFFAGLGNMNAESAFAGADGKGGFNGVSKDAARKELTEIQAKRSKGEINDHQWRTQYEKRAIELGQVVYR